MKLDQSAFSGSAEKIREWSLGMKLTGVIATLALVLLCVGALGSSRLWDASASLSVSGEQLLPFLQISTAFEREMLGARTEFVYQITVQKPRTGAQESGWYHFRAARGLAPKLRARAAESGELAKFIAPTEHMMLDLNEYEVLLGRILEAVTNHQNESPLFTTLVQDWMRVDRRLADTAAAFSRETVEGATNATRRDAGRLDSSARAIVGACLLAGLLGSFLSWLLARDLNGSLTLAAGDMTEAADRFAAVSADIAVASNVLSGGAAEQNRALQHVSAACGELGSVSRRGESDAHSLASAAAQARQGSESGIAALGQMTDALNAVAASQGKVFGIVNIVEDLAFRTNVLAVKAAAEAYRSAETARALSTLADEAGDLAQRSAQSVKETGEAIEFTTAAVIAGNSHAETVAGSLRIVADETMRAVELAGQLKADSSGQTEGIGQLAGAISQIEIATRIVNEGAGGAVTASAEISSHAAAMKKIARELTALGGGKARPRGFAQVRLFLSAPAEDLPEPTADQGITSLTEA